MQSLCLGLALGGCGCRVLGRGLLGGCGLCWWGLLGGLGLFLGCRSGLCGLALFSLGGRRLLFGFLGCMAVLLGLVLGRRGGGLLLALLAALLVLLQRNALELEGVLQGELLLLLDLLGSLALRFGCLALGRRSRLDSVSGAGLALLGWLRGSISIRGRCFPVGFG